MEQQTFRLAIVRVALLEGGTERLAVLLGVSSGLVTRWIEGLAPVPPAIFLRCCDYLAEHNQPPADESETAH